MIFDFEIRKIHVFGAQKLKGSTTESLPSFFINFALTASKSTFLYKST